MTTFLNALIIAALLALGFAVSAGAVFPSTPIIQSTGDLR